MIERSRHCISADSDPDRLGAKGHQIPVLAQHVVRLGLERWSRRSPQDAGTDSARGPRRWHSSAPHRFAPPQAADRSPAAGPAPRERPAEGMTAAWPPPRCRRHPAGRSYRARHYPSSATSWLTRGSSLVWVRADICALPQQNRSASPSRAGARHPAPVDLHRCHVHGSSPEHPEASERRSPSRPPTRATGGARRPLGCGRRARRHDRSARRQSDRRPRRRDRARRRGAHHRAPRAAFGRSTSSSTTPRCTGVDRIERLRDDDFEAVLAANLIAPFRLSRAVVREMTAGAAIVNIGAVGRAARLSGRHRLWVGRKRGSRE